MLFLEIGLAIAAFRKGWRWQVLRPVGLGFAAAFLIGMGVAAGGGSAAAATPLSVLVDLGVIAALAVMASRAPVASAPEAPRAINQSAA